ncbi:MAG: ABC transporter substrate-binding protein [Acidimicrobiales bacterium]
MTSGPRSLRWCATVLSFALAAFVPAALAPATVVAQGASAGTGALPRGRTLYTSGTSASPPSNFNPLSPRAYTGTLGLLYEPLFLYDPVRAKLMPWLAVAGSWVGPLSYRLSVRSGVDWVKSPSGALAGSLTSRDVAYSIELAATDPADPYHSEAGAVEGVSARGGTVTVHFAKSVSYAEWEEYLWHAPVLPEAVWSSMSPGGAVASPNTSPVSTGPMLLAATTAKQACYLDNPHWWGGAQLKLSFSFQYLCDLVRGSSGKALSQLLADRVDWSNQLLRGIPNVVDSKANGYGIKTYYSGTPYMLAANTAWLQMNAARPPMGTVDFRRAVAYALDPAAVARKVYTGTVQVADPTGLLPELRSFVDGEVVKKYGFSHSLATARRYLELSGYKGKHLVLTVRSGLSDLANAASMICKQLGAVGIHVSPHEVPPATRDAAIADGSYDMVINVGAGLASTPWSYFDKVYQLPVKTWQGAGVNTERFSSPAAWDLVREAGATPVTHAHSLDAIYSNLERDFLEQLPEVPLWYTGAWFQANTQRWRDFPSSAGNHDHYTPVMWPGWLGSTTTVYALAALKPS